MGVMDRMTRSLIESDVPLDRHQLLVAARRLVKEEAPLAAEDLIEQVVDSLVGLGPLELLLRDPLVSDVLVNGPEEVFVDRQGLLTRTRVTFPDDAAVVAAVERVIAPLGLRLDRASPMVDARLADGSRLHAVIPPAAVDHPLVAIRRFVQSVASLETLASKGVMTTDQSEFLQGSVTDRRNIVVSGGTGTGKTTLLNILGALIPTGERVVTIEDAAELSFPGHVVRLEGRPGNAEGKGEISLRTLLRSALRLRPDRLVLGEVRGPEALDMISALNTGHGGSMSTVHANSPEEALWRLETLALSGGERVGEAAVRRQLRAAVDLIVQLEKRDGARRLVEVAAVDGEEVRAVC
jgi:pilus assembly protein CpaF